MENLKGKTILIGKEPVNGRLLVAIVGGRTAAIGSPNSVPGSVSRCKVAEGVAHAKITVDQKGNMTMANMKPQNVTYVNGAPIVTRRITENNTVELGKDRFAVSVPVIIETANKLAVSPVSAANAKEQPPQKSYGMSHLEGVWNEYHDEVMRIKKRQKEQGVLASIPMFFTMGGGAVTFVLSFILGEEYKGEIQILSGVMVLAGLIMLAYSFIRRRNDTSIEDQDKILEDLQLKYVCPNPECQKFFGVVSYRILKNQLRSHKDQKMYCPRCGCELVDK